MEVIGVVVISIVALAVIIWKVATDKEGTLLKGITEFDLSRIPILILFDDCTPIEVITAMKNAAIFWNSSVGEKVFTFDLVESGSTVPVMPFSGNESDRRKRVAIAYVDLVLTPSRNGIKSASVKVDVGKLPDDPHMLSLILAHELGHVLGLEHDHDPASIMFGKARVRDAVVTNLDRNIVLSGYGFTP